MNPEGLEPGGGAGGWCDRLRRPLRRACSAEGLSPLLHCKTAGVPGFVRASGRLAVVTLEQAAQPLSSLRYSMTSCCLRSIHPATATSKNRHGVQVIRPGIVAASGKLRNPALTEAGRRTATCRGKPSRQGTNTSLITCSTCWEEIDPSSPSAGSSRTARHASCSPAPGHAHPHTETSGL